MGRRAPVAMKPDWPTQSTKSIRFEIPAHRETDELILKLSYSVICDPKTIPETWFRGFTGDLSLNSRVVRVDLFESRQSVEIFLGEISAPNVTLDLQDNPYCTLQMISGVANPIATTDTELDEISLIALKHSPFLVVRKDQFSNRYTDLPLQLAYRFYMDSNKNTRILDYIIYFSDEDSRSKPKSKAGAFGTYGRASDIEWVYRIEFDNKWNVFSRIYQATGRLWFIDLHVGHSTRKFKGKFIKHHPILYNSQKNNVFSDDPKASIQKKRNRAVYQLVPRIRLEPTDPVEAVLLRSAWQYRVTDLELQAEGKATTPAPDHLFVLLEGEMVGMGDSGITGEVEAKLMLYGAEFQNEYKSDGKGIDRSWIKGDTWLRNSLLTGIAVDREITQKLVEGELKGTLRLAQVGIFKPNLVLKNLRMFRIIEEAGQYTIEELTHLFKCSLDGVNSSCDLNGYFDRRPSS